MLEADALYEMLDPVLHEPSSRSRTRLGNAVRSIEWGFNISLAVLIATAFASIAWIVSGFHIGWTPWTTWIAGGLFGTTAADFVLGLRSKA